MGGHQGHAGLCSHMHLGSRAPAACTAGLLMHGQMMMHSLLSNSNSTGSCQQSTIVVAVPQP